MEHLHDVLLKLTAMEAQINRLVSDAESEKEFRKMRNREVEERLRQLEIWRAEEHGRTVENHRRTVTIVSVVSLIISVTIAVISKIL